MSLSLDVWVGIEEAFRAGIKPVLDISREMGVPESTIRDRARKLGWLRNSVTISNDRILDLVDVAEKEYAGAIKTGLQISINCLNNLKSASETATEPKEIKLITDATSSAVKTIREIAGLDNPQQGNTTNVQIINNAEQIAMVINDLQGKY